MFWLVLSLVLFLVSASIQSGSIPASAKRQLSSGSNMITGTDTVLVLGLDQRPKGSKEPGAFSGGIRSDSIMLWRIGGGTSRRLSIPRDTWVNIPGHGQSKINAAYAYGGPALAIKTVEQFTHIKINHVIIVNLANFPVFIDAIGGVDIHTGRICSTISGGAKNGGFSLFLKPGEHHLSGIQALTLARTRENSCNAASSDLTREAYQQQILNDIKSKLVSPSIIPRLPWASWDAPKALRTDMGGFTLMQLFVAAEIGGSAPTDILKPTEASVIDGQDALVASACRRAPARHQADDRSLTGADPGRAYSDSACGRFQCCQAATSRNARQATPPTNIIRPRGWPARIPISITAVPNRAADAYTLVRSTCGTTFSSTSRITPPPTAVMTPQIIAVRSFAPNSSALVAPDTANSDSPPASSTVRSHLGTCEIGVKIAIATSAPTSAVIM